MVPLASNMGHSKYLRLTDVLVEQKVPFAAYGSLVFTVSVDASIAELVRDRLRSDPRLQDIDWMSLPEDQHESVVVPK